MRAGQDRWRPAANARHSPALRVQSRSALSIQRPQSRSCASRGGLPMLRTLSAALFSGIVSIAAVTAPAGAQSVWKSYTFFSTTNHLDYQHLGKIAAEILLSRIGGEFPEEAAPAV